MPALRELVIIGLALLAAGCSDGRAALDGNRVAGDTPSAPRANNVDTMTGATLAQYSGDPVAGERAFAVCRACHAASPNAGGIGPSVHGVVGRRAAAVPGYNYSQAMRDSGIVWTPEKLFQFLENPRRVVPQTRMTFAGIGDPQRRADLIAYLETLR